jgi:hypothetical protein
MHRRSIMWLYYIFKRPALWLIFNDFVENAYRFEMDFLSFCFINTNQRESISVADDRGQHEKIYMFDIVAYSVLNVIKYLQHNKMNIISYDLKILNFSLLKRLKKRISMMIMFALIWNIWLYL